MSGSAPKRPLKYWFFLTCVGAGIFVGTFWFFLGMFLLLGRDPAWWQVVATLAPGTGIVFLTIMARHHPRPYSVGLMLLGVLPLFLVHFSSAWRLRLGFGLPLLCVGAGLWLWQGGAPVPEGDPGHG
ncbi:MAG: hypothetical protein HGA76_02395 [Candidatus Firestonebacteria bacterium]|nr:hypothetical protein [Candidatus Firestonebacteria bacterium]